MFDINKGKKKCLFPSLLIEKHSSIGVTCVHFTAWQPSNNLLLSSGNDGMVHLWRTGLHEEENSSRNKKRTQVVNTVCLNDEAKKYLMCSVNVSSKVNHVSSHVYNEQRIVVVCDQTSDVKLYPIK